jgi:ABC-type uncharacterized transport system permease subunit
MTNDDLINKIKPAAMALIKEMADKVELSDKDVEQLYLIHTAYKLDTIYRAYIRVATSAYSVVISDHPERMREFSLRFASLCAEFSDSPMQSVVDALIKKEGMVN